MMTRRAVVRDLTWLATGVGAAPLLAACAGRDASSLAAKVQRAKAPVAAVPDGVATVRAFTGDLYRRLAAAPGNIVVSPYSVAVALAMTRHGARGSTAREMDAVLHTPTVARLGAGMNALGRLLDGRTGEVTGPDRTTGTVTLRTANSLWGQRGLTWQRPFLEALARDFGAGMRLADYATQAEAARRAINGWTADQTGDRIPEIVPPGAVDASTRLVLVNAVYLKAPWLTPFQPSATSDEPFRRRDGTTVRTPTMSGELRNAEVASGPGWRAARLPYLGEKLAMAIVLPDDPARFERSLDGAGLARLLGAFHRAPLLQLRLPRWRFRQQAPLTEHLAALGMPTAFDPARADFSGMTADAALSISALLHEAFIAVDEEGTEAAAATAVVMRVSAPEPVRMIVDRPFLFLIHDVETATPLFIGRVDDPASTSD